MTLRALFNILILFLIHFGANSQQFELSHVLEYSNPGLLLFEPNGIDTLKSGIEVGYNSNQEVEKQRVSVKLDNVIFDTNSNSFVDYRMGANQYQDITFELFRPISKSSCFEFRISRNSHPGWIQRSFVRNTDIGLKIESDLSNKIKWNAIATYLVTDREQNGGLVDSTYSIKQSGTDDLHLLGSIKLQEAYSRKEVTLVRSEIRYLATENDRSSILFSLQGNGRIAKFIYSDLSSDSVYYSQFTTELFEEVNDSSRHMEVGASPRIRYVSETGIAGMQFQVDLTLHFNQGTFRVNSTQLDYSNQDVSSRIVLSKKNVEFRSRNQYFFGGYNRGDYSSTLDLIYLFGASSDSNRISYVSSLQGSLTVQKSHPYLLHANYYSSIRSNSNTLQSQEQLRTAIIYEIKMKDLSIHLQPGYIKQMNYIYFDRYGRIHQAATNIELYKAEVSIIGKKKAGTLLANGVYQWNNRNRINSLPEWMYKVEVLANVDVLKEKLTFHPGIRTMYNSGFYSRGYLPFYDSFYVQRSQKFEPYFQADAMAYITVGQVDVGFEAVNLLYGLIDDNPIIAPNYTSIPRYFLFHIVWKLKN